MKGWTAPMGEIPLGSRLIAVADSYDALTTDRPYRTARTHDEAVAELQRCEGTQFDPEVVLAFSEAFQHLSDYFTSSAARA